MTHLLPPAWRRARYLAALALVYGALCLLQRFVYVAWIRVDGTALPEGILPALLKGFVFDAATCGWLFLVVAVPLVLLPVRWQNRRFGRALVTGFSLLTVLVGLLSISFEFFFWEEFHSRYNFIAVDYLVYTHEVVRNIWESYPVVWFFLGLGLVLGFVAWRLRLRVRAVAGAPFSPAERAAIAAAFVFLIGLNLTLRQDGWLESDPVWGQELAKNSLYALFSAYNSNEIDYKKFYLSLDQKESDAITAKWLAGGSASISRDIKNPGPEKHWNVMLVGIESMSARFLMHYGEETKNLTPNLDRMADEGLFFTHLYATGSRTVRGLEALNLSLPPTPGQSILRRPNSDHLFTLGSVLRTRGYDVQFVYGGHAIFDNMGPWFSSNGYQIVDKGEFAPGGVHFATAWGACDEDLFDESIRRADASFASGKHFFQMIMTTSNHRPYDFPEGRIDIHSHTGRDGAIKYTDYAIGRFVKESEKKPWFKDTVFIFVADHNASVAGGTEIPIRDYLIPVIFYNPSLLKPQKVDKLSSQMDVAPTLLGLMNFSYKSWFFGADLLREPANRALLGTYQKVALLEPGKLTILEPNRRAVVQELGPLGQVLKSSPYDATSQFVPDEVKRAVAVYQSASEVFTKGLSKVTDTR
jgi:phosphoglycerol transferase MdoB-like AlkP superfamily enzyme